MKSYLVTPDVWKPVMHETLLPLNLETRNLAYALVSALHSRHVGITPGLAADAATMLLSATTSRQSGLPRSQDNVWLAALDVVRQKIAVEEKQNPRQPRRSLPGKRNSLLLGVLPHVSIHYLTWRVIQPIVMRACADLGEVYLFCEDSSGCDIHERAAYNSYAQKLNQQVHTLVNKLDDPLIDLFWRDRALTLMALTHQHGHSSVTPLPRTLLPESRMFLDLRPEAQLDQHRIQSLDLSKRQKLDDPRLTEVGADGAKLTHRLEEIHHALPIEWVYPPLMRWNRILNEGYWVVKPPPKPVQMRDVLVLALCPAEIARSPVSIFLKTCWFDFILHLSRLLKHNGISESEIRWIEGEAGGRMRAHALLVNRLPELLTLEGDENHDTVREYFLRASGWYPSYLSLDNSSVQVGRHTPDAKPLEWLAAMWNAQNEFAGWNPGSTVETGTAPTLFERQKLQLNTYTFVYVMIFWPSQRDVEAIKPLYRYVLGRFHEAHSISITSVPKQIMIDGGWRFDGRRQKDEFKQENESLSLERLAGRLVARWLNNFTDEVQHA